MIGILFRRENNRMRDSGGRPIYRRINLPLPLTSQVTLCNEAICMSRLPAYTLDQGCSQRRVGAVALPPVSHSRADGWAYASMGIYLDNILTGGPVYPWGYMTSCDSAYVIGPCIYTCIHTYIFFARVSLACSRAAGIWPGDTRGPGRRATRLATRRGSASERTSPRAGGGPAVPQRTQMHGQLANLRQLVSAHGHVHSHRQLASLTPG